MSALPFLSNVFKLVLQYAMPGVVDILNRLFFSYTGSYTNAAANTYCSNVANDWASNMAAVSIPDLALTSVSLSDLSSATSPVGAWTGSKPGTGSTTPISAPGMAFIIKNITPYRYRGGHSRTYLPGIEQSSQSSAGATTWGATPLGTILGDWLNFITAISGSSGPTGTSALQQVVPHYYSGFTSVQNPITKRYRNVPTKLTVPFTDPVSSLAANLIIGSQRRRNHQSP